MTNPVNIKISVIVCTHNRADLLPKVIDSLRTQSLRKEEYEIIVVDNASTDKTKEVCLGYRSVTNFNYVYESVPGLSVARNSGMNVARGKYVAFIDDDAITSPQWLEKLVDAFEHVRPTPDSVGGKIFPIWENPRPVWFPDNKNTYFTILDYGDVPKFIKYPDILFGTNMAFRKNTLVELGGFRSDVGRKKKKLLSGEEADIFVKFAERGFLAYYITDASVQHLVPKERISKQWLYRRHYWQARSEELVHRQLNERFNLSTELKSSYLKIKCATRKSFTERDPSGTNNFVFIATLYEQFGKWYGYLNRLFTNKKQFSGVHNFSPEINHPMNAVFGDVIEFLGYSLDSFEVTPGVTMKIVYYWKCLKELDIDYTVFVHFLQNEKIIFQNDHPLKNSRWQSEGIFSDLQMVIIPPNLNGEFNMVLGIWNPPNGGRLPIINSGFGQADQWERLTVGTLQVKS